MGDRDMNMGRRIACGEADSMWRGGYEYEYEYYRLISIWEQRLLGASLLVFANKTDVSGCMTVDEIREVSQRKLLVAPQAP